MTEQRASVFPFEIPFKDSESKCPSCVIELPEALRVTVEDYIGVIDSATLIKRALVECEGERRKIAYMTKLKDTYTALMDAVERALKKGDDLNWDYSDGDTEIIEGEFQGTIHAAVATAFLGVKRDLQEKGWSPVIEEDCTTGIASPYQNKLRWSINIACSFVR